VPGRGGQAARAVTLREHIGLAHQPAQGFEIRRLAQVELGRELAMPGVPLLVAEIGQVGGADLITSAPCSARVRAQVGPASTRVRSSTRMPASGRSPAGNGSGGLSPMRTISISGKRRWRRPVDAASIRLRPHHAAAPLAAMIASSRSAASHLATAAATALRSSAWAAIAPATALS